MKLIDEKGVDYSLNNKPAVALLTLLIIFIILNVITLIITILSNLAFKILVFLPAFLNKVILIVYISIYLSIKNYKVGEYILYKKLYNVLDKAILKVRF